MSDTIDTRYKQLHKKFTIECTRNHIITDPTVLQDLSWFIEQRINRIHQTHSCTETGAEQTRAVNDTLLLLRVLRQSLLSRDKAEDLDFSVHVHEMSADFCLEHAVTEQLYITVVSLLHVLRGAINRRDGSSWHAQYREWCTCLTLMYACMDGIGEGDLISFVRQLEREKLLEYVDFGMQVLKSVIYGDYWNFFKLRRRTQSRRYMQIMDFAAEKIRAYTLRAMQRAYYAVPIDHCSQCLSLEPPVTSAMVEDEIKRANLPKPIADIDDQLVVFKYISSSSKRTVI